MSKTDKAKLIEATFLQVYLDREMHVASITVSACLACPGLYPANLEVWLSMEKAGSAGAFTPSATTVLAGETPDKEILEADNKRTSVTVIKELRTFHQEFSWFVSRHPEICT